MIHRPNENTREFCYELVDEAVLAHHGETLSRDSAEWQTMHITVTAMLKRMTKPNDYMVYCAEGLSDFTLMEGAYNANTQEGRIAEMRMAWQTMIESLLFNNGK